MNDTPTRRWPRFKLSTILLLVGIAAWAMSSRPFWTDRDELGVTVIEHM